VIIVLQAAGHQEENFFLENTSSCRIQTRAGNGRDLKALARHEYRHEKPNAIMGL
jgi:hypothetical protein